ncbi:MAG TPA: hypothetical protein VE442_16770 [Jatrophihabitans sp.]|jgi:hypothetical protein|nr:hypothetical protein [Jatrophihabitans sp.]
MSSEPLRGDPSPRGADAEATRRAEHSESAFNSGDLAVLLSELHRVRDADETDGQSAGEAMTLAATAIRIVEDRLARAGHAGLTPDDLALAREVLRSTLEALKAAAARIDIDDTATEGARFRLRRPRRKARGQR